MATSFILIATLLTNVMIINPSSALNITVCDCKAPQYIGIMDTETPAYCRPKIETDPIIADYTFFIKEEPHMSWEGYVCKAWLKKKTIDGFFFGGYDTVFYSEIQHLSEDDCIRMQQTKLCGENKMTEDGNQYVFTSEPTGEGVWMQTETFKAENCMLQKIMLKKDCSACPITSPFGPLKVNGNETFVFHDDSVIIWSKQNRNLEKECKIKQLRKSSGSIIKISENTYKLVDTPGQLDYIYTDEIQTICNYTIHKLKNINGAYVRIQPKNKTHIFNLETKLCINENIRSPVNCSSVPDGQFSVSDNRLNFQNFSRPNKNKMCIFMSHFNHRIEECRWVFQGIHALEWNPNTLKLSVGNKMIVQCLQMNGNQSVTLNTCTGENNQKWILGTPNNPTTEDLEAKEPLLLQHHQFIEDQSVNNENIIENELKRIYCNNFKKTA